MKHVGWNKSIRFVRVTDWWYLIIACSLALKKHMNFLHDRPWISPWIKSKPNLTWSRHNCLIIVTSSAECKPSEWDTGSMCEDRRYLCLYQCSHNPMKLMHRKFNDDIFAHFLVITKNVISFIEEYRGPTLKLPYDIIDDVIITKITFFGIIWNDLFIYEVKLKLCSIIRNLQNGCHFELVTNFLLEVIPEVEYTRKIAISISDILSFWLTLWIKYWRRCVNFKIWPSLWPCDVINDVMSSWNITCTTRHPQQCTCKILFVWHQSFIVKSSGQTSRQT